MHRLCIVLLLAFLLTFGSSCNTIAIEPDGGFTDDSLSVVETEAETNPEWGTPKLQNKATVVNNSSLSVTLPDGWRVYQATRNGRDYDNVSGNGYYIDCGEPSIEIHIIYGSLEKADHAQRQAEETGASICEFTFSNGEIGRQMIWQGEKLFWDYTVGICRPTMAAVFSEPDYWEQYAPLLMEMAETFSAIVPDGGLYFDLDNNGVEEYFTEESINRTQGLMCYLDGQPALFVPYRHTGEHVYFGEDSQGKRYVVHEMWTRQTQSPSGLGWIISGGAICYVLSDGEIELLSEGYSFWNDESSKTSGREGLEITQLKSIHYNSWLG